MSSAPTYGPALPLIALQLGSRLFSFILNQALLRITTPSAFGTATIHFELLLNTILFLSREGVRIALLRSNISASTSNNVSFIPFLLGCPVAIATSYFYLGYAGTQTSAQPYFREAVLLYVLGALIELLKEPMHNVVMSGLNTNVRLRAEGAAVAGKSILTFLVMFFDPHREDPTKHRALLAFALGQMLFSICVLAIYVYHLGFSYMLPEFPKPTNQGKRPPFFNSEVLRLSATITSQSLVKHFLTEGDKFILSWFSPLEDQGGYAIALNYGSLVARIVLQPLEETSRSLFSQLLSKNELQTGSTRLTNLLSLQIPLSLILPTFGPAYIALAAQILLPPKYLSTSAPQVLSAWLWYIPILALNGQVEAFMASAANTSDLNRQSTWMAFFSIIYIGSAVLSYKIGLGDRSLVYANVLNLSARIVFSAMWISNYFQRKGHPNMFSWKSVMPSFASLGLLLFSGTTVRLMERWLDVDSVISQRGRGALFSREAVLHIGIGGVLVLISLWRTTRVALSRQTKRE